MKRTIFIILLLMVVTLFSAAPIALSQEDLIALECPGSPPIRLAPGMTAFVVIPPEGEARRDLRVRAEPGGEQVGSLSSGQYFVVTGESVCAGDDDLRWWPIESRDGSLSGWSVEGFAPDDYLMIPDGAADSPAQPTAIPDAPVDTEGDPCSAATPTRLEDGVAAYAAMPTEGEASRALRVRAEPGGEQVGSLAAGTVFRITGEAECDSEGLRWWPILTLDSAVRGWSAEALSADNYLITPIELRNREVITTRNAISLMVMDKVGLGLQDPNNPSIPNDMVFSPDGSMLVVSENELTVWSMTTGELIRRLPYTTDYYANNVLAFSPSGKFLAVEIFDGIQILTMPDGTEVDLIEGQAPFEWSPDGSLFAYTSPNADSQGFVLLFMDAASGQVQGRIVDHELTLKDITFSSDGSLLGMAADVPIGQDSSGEPTRPNQHVYLWNMDEVLQSGEMTIGMEQTVFEVGESRVEYTIFAPDSKTLTVERFSQTRFDDGEGLPQGYIHFLDVETGLERAKFFGETAPAYSPDGTILATITQRDKRAFRLWNAKLGGEIAPFGEAGYQHEPFPVKIVFSPDGTLMTVLWHGYFPFSSLQLWGIPTIQ